MARFDYDARAFVVQLCQLILTVLGICLLVVLLFNQRELQRNQRNLLWEVNRHTLIMVREGARDRAEA